jgi:hypothetical protein
MAETVRELSNRLFKAAYRLEVGAAIAKHVQQNERFCNKQLAAELGDPPGKNGVSGELKTLRRSGLIRDDERLDRTQYLRAEPSSYWDMCRDLSKRAQEYLDRSS